MFLLNKKFLINCWTFKMIRYNIQFNNTIIYLPAFFEWWRSLICFIVFLNFYYPPSFFYHSSFHFTYLESSKIIIIIYVFVTATTITLLLFVLDGLCKSSISLVISFNFSLSLFIPYFHYTIALILFMIISLWLIFNKFSSISITVAIILFIYINL